MCGIAGIIAAETGRLDLRSVAEQMQGTLMHRGPDDFGLFMSVDGLCALAHTRLSILDLSSAGHQPMGLRELGEIRNSKSEIRNGNGIGLLTMGKFITTASCEESLELGAASMERGARSWEQGAKRKATGAKSKELRSAGTRPPSAVSGLPSIPIGNRIRTPKLFCARTRDGDESA